MVKATFKRGEEFKNNGWFTGKADMQIPRGSTAAYALKFNPEFLDTAECEL